MIFLLFCIFPAFISFWYLNFKFDFFPVLGILLAFLQDTFLSFFFSCLVTFLNYEIFSNLDWFFNLLLLFVIHNKFVHKLLVSISKLLQIIIIDFEIESVPFIKCRFASLINRLWKYGIFYLWKLLMMFLGCSALFLLMIGIGVGNRWMCATWPCQHIGELFNAFSIIFHQIFALICYWFAFFIECIQLTDLSI